MITLITATGGRPEAFKLCEHYISRQTYKGPMQWIVVDDCTPQTVCTMKQEYFRGPKDWKDGINTQRLNLDSVIKHIKGEHIFIIEDDDYYAPKYIEHHLNLARSVSMIGESRSKYFNLRVPGWKIMPNLKHSSLAQTSFDKSLLPAFERAVNSGHLYFDVSFWDNANANQVPSVLIANKNLCIGIKGMPGREGITGGHRSKDYMYDANLKILREWIGNDANPYLNFIKGKESWKTNVPAEKPAVTSTILSQAKALAQQSKIQERLSKP